MTRHALVVDCPAPRVTSKSLPDTPKAKQRLGIPIWTHTAHKRCRTSVVIARPYAVAGMPPSCAPLSYPAGLQKRASRSRHIASLPLAATDSAADVACTKNWLITPSLPHRPACSSKPSPEPRLASLWTWRCVRVGGRRRIIRGLRRRRVSIRDADGLATAVIRLICARTGNERKSASARRQRKT